PPDEVFALCDKLGEIPVPPYVTNQPDQIEKYQTIYAKERGSVAAPTAGFHFTPELFEALEKKGVKKAFVTLHVGLGTFRPMKTETLEEHQMHEEWYSIPEETQNLIEETKKSGHRVIAVGTTTVRALESWAASRSPLTSSLFEGRNSGEPTSGFTSLFITPGYSFRVIDGLMTNFHLPKSTLIVLVSSFAGRELIMRAYRHAIDNAYRFYSFGDAMLIY
ncbi:MAG: tRNA preQ1(34) S-adenosylmethionine ribosyltransferase-isomerase QueA, partial [bacterium]|nr:tRNA preQ1(34) S-adenosylmethionine ribosyltransferase-isomerase QueA [bacterium]